jgi:hypothetical protein
MVMRKILERLRGSRKPVPVEQSPVSLERAPVSLEQAQAEFEAAHHTLREAQRKAEAEGELITPTVIAAAQRVDALRQRLTQAKADFVLAGGTPEAVELTELVTRKVKQWFPADEQAEAISLLETECGRNLPFCEAYDAKGLEVVRLAVVKLAGGSLVELRRQVEAAKEDWRDVIAFAQAPEEVKRSLFTGAEVDAETSEIRARDRRQYEDWLRGDGPLGPSAA